ncbi:MAG: RagB/SusD family nutrient uptake outer membrane protein [Tannerellaceae bacterium]|jgi:hypothetical protein|nr:RagB/SusD family nutrient uptake outer membrane protein [Tannerellaceae bacterium]
MKHLLNIFIIAALIMSSVACDDFLTYAPSDAVDDTEAFKTAKDITNALNGVYYTLGRYEFYGRNVIATGDIAADNTYMLGTSGHFNDIYQFTLNESTDYMMHMWEYGYKVLDRATRLITAGKALLAEGVTSGDEATIRAAIAQAYALKALAHFTLVNIYGLPYSSSNTGSLGIVIIDEDIIPPFQEVHRSTVADAYAQVLKEIGLAKEGISAAGSSAFHFNAAAVAALEARVKLYMADWGGAISAAQSGIELRKGSLVMTPSNYVNMWFDIVPTSEDIFTISKTADDNLSANSLNTLYGSYNGKATSGLIAIFAENDMRLGLFGDGTGEQIRALKFDGLPSSKATSNIPVFRLPELYLIIAEAKAQLGQADAVDALFEVARRNPDLQQSDIPTDKAGLLKFISAERRRELFQEGHRLFDLRRTGELMTRSGGNFPISNWDASKFVYPIPANEINASGLEQNTGWSSALPPKS